MNFSTPVYAAGNGVTTLSPSYPANDSSMVLFAVVNVVRTDDISFGSPAVTGPAGWTSILDNSSFGLGVYRAIWRKVGDGSTGTVTWSWSAVPVRGEVVLFTASDINTSSPVDVSNFKNETGLTSTHTTNSITTTQADDTLLGVWAASDSGINYNASDDLPNTLINLAGIGGGGAERPLLIAYANQPAAGASGTKTATSNGNSFTQMFLLGLKAIPNPSVPVLTYPNGGETLTAGASVSITWTASTSPTAAQSSLKYNLDYSSNNGVSWTSIVSLTSAGVTSYSWTVPASPLSGGYLVRIRSNDPAASLFSLAYDQSNAAFSVIAEAAPSAPTGLSPTSSYPAQNKASVVTLSWVHGGGGGNPQTQFTLQWSRDAFASHTATVGPTTTATQSTTIDFSGEAVGATITWRVKTRGVSLYSVYSTNTAFVVASLPTTPNITAPTAGSPPTTPLPTISHTITSGETQASRRIRIVQGGTEVYNNGFETTSLLSVTSPYAFANGVAYTLYIAIRNQYGLESAEDSETFTAAYTGPATPTLTVTAIPDGGYVLATINNSDAMSYDELWRYKSNLGKTTAIKAGASLPKNVSFADYNIGANDKITSSGRDVYFARAYNSTGLYTDSSDSSVVTMTLNRLWLHAVSRTNTANNVSGVAVQLNNMAPNELAYLEQEATHDILGRGAVGVGGQSQWRGLNVVAVILFSDELSLTRLLALYRLNTTVCARNKLNDRIFGEMSQPRVAAQVNYWNISFTITESAYTEGL